MANAGIANIAVIAVLSSGCATGRVQVESAYCEVRPYSPVAVNKTLGWAELLELYLRNSTPDQLAVSQRAADRVERAISSNPKLDVEDAFFERMLIELKRGLPPFGNQDADLNAVICLERQGAALASAGRMRERDEAEIERILPATTVNLTNKMNLVILGASCSTAKHPRIAAELSRRGVGCGS